MVTPRGNGPAHSLSRAMSRLRTIPRRVPPPLALLLGAALVLSVAWSLATAPFQGPDEAEHFAYIEHLATTGHIPSAEAGRGPYGLDENVGLQQGFSRTLFNPLVRPPWSALQEQHWNEVEDGLPADARKTGDGPNQVGKNPPLYYALATVVDKLTFGVGLFGRAFALRLLGTVLLLATVALTWMAMGELFGPRRMLPRTVATAVVALLPMDGFISAVVNTDPLLATIWTAFLWLALRTVRLGLSGQRAATLSLIAVLSVLTHGRGLAILPPLAVVLLVAWLHHHRGVRSTLAAIAGSGVTLAAGFVVYRLVTSAAGASGSLYGGEVNLGQKGTFSIRAYIENIWEFYLPRLPFMNGRPGPAIGYRQIVVDQYLTGVFGSQEIAFGSWVSTVTQWAFAALVVAGLVAAFANRRAVATQWAKLVVLAATGGAMLALLHLASYRSLANGTGNPLIVGRYLVAVTPLLGAGVGGVVALLPRRAAVPLAVVVAVALIALSLGGLGLTLERFYA
jgi:hypothetical protein